MATFLQDLWESIFTPGPTPSLLIATNVSFAALQVVLLVLLIATYSIHFFILSGLSAGLWWAINWFARELKEAQRLEELEKARAPVAPPNLTSSEDETEVESTPAPKPRVPKEKKTAQAAAPGAMTTATGDATDETMGELKHRAAAVATELAPPASSASTKSGMSTETEDEWEKVSENEQEKDR